MGDNPEAVAEMHLAGGCKDLTKRDAEALLEIVRLLQKRGVQSPEEKPNEKTSYRT